MKLCPGAVQCTIFAFPNTENDSFEVKMVRRLVQQANVSTCINTPFTLV